MTKMKSKKMTKSAFAMIIMAIVMVAMIAFGGTYAYFSATDNTAASDFVDTAKVQIGNKTTITKNEALTLAPGEKVAGPTVTMTNSSTTEVYVFINITAKVDAKDLFVDVSGTKESILAVVPTTSTGWTQIGTTNTYWTKVAANTAAIPAFAFELQLNSNVEAHYDADSAETQKEANNVLVGTLTQGTWSYADYTDAIMGKTLSVGVDLSAIQTYGYELANDVDPTDMTVAYNASINAARVAG